MNGQKTTISGEKRLMNKVRLCVLPDFIKRNYEGQNIEEKYKVILHSKKIKKKEISHKWGFSFYVVVTTLANKLSLKGGRTTQRIFPLVKSSSTFTIS